MPNLPISASPVATAAVATNATPAVDSGDDTTTGSPFATVLQEQLAAQILMPAAAAMERPAAESAAPEAPADTFLPLLLGIAGQSTTPGAGPQAPAPAIIAASDNPQLLAADPSISIPLALPAIGIQPGQPQQTVGAGETAQSQPTATSAGQATAILAATADATKGGRVAFPAEHTEESLAGLTADGAGARAEAMQQAHTPQARAAEQATRIEAPLGSRQWDGEFANRLAWMVGKHEQRADLVLTPPQLGRIEVSLSVHGEQATAIFTSASATVRDAIENALPRLREVLQESGISLGQAQVGSESPQQQQPARDENRDNRGNAVTARHDNRVLPPGFATNSPTAWVSSGRGMIDVFA